MERKEAKQNKKRIEAIIKSEREKWALLKRHQEIKKEKANIGNYDKYIIQEPNQIRILVLGESFSGKTTFIRRFIKNEFIYEYKTTTSIESFKSELLFFEDDSYKVELIDTPPLEKFYTELPSIIYFVQGIIFLFDASNKNSFLRIQDYYKMITFYNFQKTGIIATKKDICTENDKYKFYQLKKFCKEYDAIPYFLSVKKDKKEIYNFINLFCPTIIPSLVNKKKEIKFDYPYTKSAQNIIPKENNLDKEILKKLKEDDSSYESVKDEQNNKKINREDLFKEYIKKKEKEKNTKKRKKINTLFNIYNLKYEINKDYKNKNFMDVIGEINLDLEKLFRKYRPDSDEKSKKRNKNKKYYNQNKENEEKESKNKILKDKEEWVNINVDELIDKFMKTKDDFYKKIEKIKESEKQKNENNDNLINSQKLEEIKDKYKMSEDESDENDKEKNNEHNSKKDEKKENKNEEEKKEIEKNGKDEKNEEEESEEEEEKNEEIKNDNDKEIQGKDDKNEDNLENDNYEDLSNDILEFQKSLMDEAERQKEY